MKRVNLVCPSLVFSSFAYVARITRTWIELLNTATIKQPIQVALSTSYTHGWLNIRIDDLALTLRDAKPCDVAWLDTALLVENVHPRVKSNPARIFTCSRWDKDKAEGRGVKILDIVPRPFSPLAYKFRGLNRDKDYDFCIIGWFDKPDRKNFEAMSKVVEKLNAKTVAITNYRGSWQRLDFSSIADHLKFELLARSKYLLHLSGSEGFGMPVLEAMAVGTPVIYLDRPAHSEFAVGVKVPVKETVKLRHRLGVIESATVDVDEAVEIARQALDFYGKSAYEDLSEVACVVADTLLSKFLSWIRSIVFGE